MGCSYHFDPHTCGRKTTELPLRDINEDFFVVFFPECPWPRLSSQTSVVTKGQNVSLICSTKKKSLAIKYSFFRGEKYLRSEDTKGESNIFNLSISEAHDLGPYKCKVQDPINGDFHCAKYSPDFTFTSVDPVATPVLNISVIQTEAGLYIILRCISLNGSLPINYTFFEKNVAMSPAISKDEREPAEFNFTKKSIQGGEEYKCKAKNRWSNNAKYSQRTTMPSIGKSYLSQILSTGSRFSSRNGSCSSAHPLPTLATCFQCLPSRRMHTNSGGLAYCHK
ncbi:allergin-1-like [Loxodonta africana]|uniref:allergin-1-like n=1 Tax=Loxodonta africana TaxID=9785 RepID=UPI0030D5E9FF